MMSQLPLPVDDLVWNDGTADPSTIAAIQAATEMVQMKQAHTPPPKRRCRHPGCNRVIKSQGFCQRHGAKVKRCKVEGCGKQSQGTHDGYCKNHWKTMHPKKVSNSPDPEGQSVYAVIIPQSIAYRPPASLPDHVPPKSMPLMPLVLYLRQGCKAAAGWHRNSERRARGVVEVADLEAPLEPWERQLAVSETLLLSGGTLFANFADLAHAWGQPPGFHAPLSQSVFASRGQVSPPVNRKREKPCSRRAATTEAMTRETEPKKAKAV